MQHVVYVLGAGFSAPLGLPVMRNFLVKSKDMFALHPRRFSQFEQVFKLIDRMGKIQSYYQADLFNIEEVLSILEMDERIARSRSKRFSKYIGEVITYFTPPDPEADPPRFPGNWRDRPMSQNLEWLPYLFFAASLLKIRMRQDLSNANRTFPISLDDSNNVQYSIVTLNYDLIFEKLARYLLTFFPNEGKIEFALRSAPINEQDRHIVPLAKLHGSVDIGSIIAPTWNKTVSGQTAKVWDAASDLLSSANEIRLLGYSLPLADAYIKYLLKSAVITCKHLKQIDIICRDGDGATRDRYRDFVAFKYTRYSSGEIATYLKTVQDLTSSSGRPSDGSLKFDQLESAHSTFMNSYSETL